MLHIQLYDEADYSHLDYELPPEQAIFTSSINQLKGENAFSDPQKSIVSVLFDNIPCGFFILDQGDEKFKLTDNESSLLLRSFSINPLFQGKGLGKKTMLLISDYIRKNHPNIKQVVLSVNVKNVNAYHTYLKAGYNDIRKYLEGPFGRQHILVKDIDPA